MADTRLLSGLLFLEVELEDGTKIKIVCPNDLIALAKVYEVTGSEYVKNTFELLRSLCIEFLEASPELPEADKLLVLVRSLRLTKRRKSVQEFMKEVVKEMEALVREVRDEEVLKVLLRGYLESYVKALSVLAFVVREPEYFDLVRWLLKLARRAASASKCRASTIFLLR